MYSSLALPLYLKPYSIPHSTLLFPIPKLFPHSLYKSHICHSTNPSNYDREEIRWLREEQRWLREEQRWLREEQRWAQERDSLLHQISDLKLRIQALEHQNAVQAGGASVSEAIAKIVGLLQVLKEKGLIAESGSSATPMLLLEEEEQVEKEEEVVEKKAIKFSVEGEKKRRKTLRMGSEGDEVRVMQIEDQDLGLVEHCEAMKGTKDVQVAFMEMQKEVKEVGKAENVVKCREYMVVKDLNGEEDMEYSSFSSGTERAVKTWQSTLGAPEDGIMTAELLERLYMARPNVAISPKEGANGAPAASITDISEVQQKVVKEEGFTEVEVSQHRVFLLGENRWEEPSRLVGRDKQVGNIKTKDVTTKCLTCRGEGRLMCTECDGTGEPNIEPQFLEWVDEGTKCPYCEGHGFITCDVCEGKAMI
ncbi:hypothetical protein CJ030_MR5G016193 [Morella rubra]|uniref:Peptidoglycan binding-like domain-containing protein n=1 Tax=Morella rubra TaxID=262757 RepID=A0A6A1VL90_9ROSI|nr:hypothetical protein CJ030_MR5G016193 [Morella rubra]